MLIREKQSSPPGSIDIKSDRERVGGVVMEELGDRELLSGPIQISGRRCFSFLRSWWPCGSGCHCVMVPRARVTAFPNWDEYRGTSLEWE